MHGELVVAIDTGSFNVTVFISPFLFIWSRSYPSQYNTIFFVEYCSSQSMFVV